MQVSCFLTCLSCTRELIVWIADPTFCGNPVHTGTHRIAGGRSHCNCTTLYIAPEQCYIFIRTAGLMVSVWCIFCVTGAAGHGHLNHYFSSACASGICLFSTLHVGNTYLSSSSAYFRLVPDLLQNNAAAQRGLQYNPQMTFKQMYICFRWISSFPVHIGVSYSMPSIDRNRIYSLITTSRSRQLWRR